MYNYYHAIANITKLSCITTLVNFNYCIENERHKFDEGSEFLKLLINGLFWYWDYETNPERILNTIEHVRMFLKNRHFGAQWYTCGGQIRSQGGDFYEL